MTRRLNSLLLAGLLLSGAALAQYPAPVALPVSGPSPLLFVRFTGPAGMQATFFQGRAKPRSFAAPVVVGLRPGYSYRLQLSNLPNRPGVTLFPTVEVRGSLKLQPRFGAHCFPATVYLGPDDLEAAALGSLITKVIYLEDPDRAEPRAAPPGEILESEILPDRDIFNEARNRGRLMLVVHMGERVPTAEELVTINVPGTMLFPGEKSMGPAWAPPSFNFARPGFYDPWHGPRPLDEECLHDGGDRLAKAGFDSQGELAGVDPEDTVAEYRDSGGRRRISCSNRVCLCVPRFAALRKECPLALQESVLGPIDRTGVKRQVLIQERSPPLEANKYEQPKGLEGRFRPSENINVKSPGLLVQIKVIHAQHIDIGPLEFIGTKRILTLTDIQKTKLVKQLELVKEFSQIVNLAGIDQITQTAVIARIEGGPETIFATVAARDLTVCCNEAPIPPDRPLVLIKCADKGCAQPGDIVTFTLRYSNVGGRAITDVAVADSLSGRLEYVPGSAESDRDAVFTQQMNEASSALLRWEITGRLLPGQSGRLRFQARVR
jgi:uncharacterized repeat protein (TIGR01451 family)